MNRHACAQKLSEKTLQQQMGRLCVTPFCRDETLTFEKTRRTSAAEWAVRGSGVPTIIFIKKQQHSTTHFARKCNTIATYVHIGRSHPAAVSRRRDGIFIKCMYVACMFHLCCMHVTLSSGVYCCCISQLLVCCIVVAVAVVF